MLKDQSVVAIVAVSNLDRAKKFYGDVLELNQEKEVGGGALFNAGHGTNLFVYERPQVAGSGHTEASFVVDNVANEVSQLREKGVVFEEYDMPGIKTEDGIASMDSVRSAWFKDPDGNILAISEM